MPITFVLDETRKHVNTTVSGPITGDDIVGHFQAIRRSHAFGWTELVDVRNVSPPWLTSSEIWRVASVMRDFPAAETPGPRAVLVGSDLNFGLARMFANLLGDRAVIQIFRDGAEAEAWLAGISRPRPQA
jgi:hypothetical protein